MFDQARLAPMTPMVDAIRAARGDPDRARVAPTLHAAPADRSATNRRSAGKWPMIGEETRVERTGIEPVTSSLQS
jgi:hypothetical protein